MTDRCPGVTDVCGDEVRCNLQPDHGGLHWYGRGIAWTTPVTLTGCYICRPDDPDANPEGCEGCEQDWMEMAMHMLEDQS